ncbi:MAG TPA: pilus assembly protein TadG-related protein [Gaiellaceae bacterium]|nr:pilus assembly protein TadG-related protein [Gaiellaceae bacterium]
MSIFRDERGGVLVLVAVCLPVIILFASFVLDVGHWFEHKRHLQLQADAGALAAGGVFRIPCADAPVEAEARRYAGDPTQATRFNAQVPPTDDANVHVLINSGQYWNDGGSDYSDGGGPCAAKHVDVKITEGDLPFFFGLAGSLVPAINAHARVEIQQQTTSAGALPVGVPDNNPTAAAAIFVNAGTGTVLATESLSKGVSTTLNGKTVTTWSGAATPVDISAANNTVIIALSGRQGWAPTGGTLSAICNEVLVECYSVTIDATGTVTGFTGLSFIHGYSTAGTGTPLAPIVRDTILYRVGCGDDSAPYFLLNAGCTVGVKTMIDFGPTGPDPSLPPAQGGIGAEVKVAGWGCPNGGANPKGCALTYNVSGANAGYWTTTAAAGYPGMPADGLAHSIDLNWKTATSSAQTLTSVHRSFSASSATSGPVDYVSVSEIGPGANSLAFGTHNLSVTIGVEESLQANSTDPNAAPVYLKVVGGSQNQALDCQEGANLRDELGSGCTPTYAINPGIPCESYQYYVLPQTADWYCVRTQTGGQNGQVTQGMLDRTQGGSNSCVNPNHWTDANGDGVITIPEDIPDGDPRLIPVFVTPFGSFGGSGNAVVPIVNFATFYVTGFSAPGNGGGQGDPCPGADPVPGGGYIVGHFIKYIDALNQGGGGGAPCDFSSFGTCVAVLTE